MTEEDGSTVQNQLTDSESKLVAAIKSALEPDFLELRAGLKKQAKQIKSLKSGQRETTLRLDQLEGKMASRLKSLKSGQRETTLRLDQLEGKMASLKAFGGGGYLLPARGLVPQGNSLQEGADDYVPPNPFY